MKASLARLAPLLLFGAFTGGCSDWGFELREGGEVREIEAVALDGDEVSFAVDVVDDHLGWHLIYTAGGRGSLPKGVHFPEDEWRPRPVIDVRRDGVPLEFVETHNREWYRIGSPHETEAEALAVAESMRVEHCESPGLVVYRYVGEGYASRWKSIRVAADVASHGRASVRDAPDCLAALKAEEALPR